MIAHAQQLFSDGIAWLTKGVHINPAVAAISAVVFLILWIATARREPARSGDGE